jgi:heme exporter protein A
MQIELQGISKSYGRLAVLKNCDLQLESGQLLCLLGNNGAGKTTLLRIVSGLLSPDKGKLLVDDIELSLKSPEWRRKCALVAHKTFLYQNLSGLENLRFFSKLYQHDLPDKELRDRLAEAGLARAGDKQVRSFSRGMQQRLTIARALLSNPDIVILDEPFTGLDKDGSALLMRMLADLKRRGAMVLMTSHDPQAALAVTDGFVRLSRGVLSEVVWVDGRGWSEIEPLLYDVSTPAFEEQSDAGETSRSKPALGQETGTIGTITTPSSDCLRPACGSGGRGVTEE